MARRLLCRQPLRSLRAGCADANLGSDAGLQPRKRRAERRRAASTPPQPDAAGLRPETSALSERPWSGWTLQEERGPRPLVQRAIYFGLQGDDKCRTVAACPTRICHDCAQSGRTLGRDAMRAPDVRVLTAVSEVRRAEWDALLSPASTPFVRHAWLQALERSGCATARTGWDPRHLTLWRGTKLVAAAPGYARDDSDGDFSRDWDLAASLSRGEIGYYPKLALTVPFTPCTGERLLVAPGEDRASCAERIVHAARKLCADEGYPTWQVLFPDEAGARELEQAGMALRVSWQFHWRNEGYRSMAEFLARFNSKRRHMLKREMAAAPEQGLVIRTGRGEELQRDPARWAKAAHALHRSTVDKLMWGRVAAPLPGRCG